MTTFIDNNVDLFAKRLNSGQTFRLGEVSSADNEIIWADDVKTLISVMDAMAIVDGRRSPSARLTKYMSCIDQHNIVSVPVVHIWKNKIFQDCKWKKMCIVPMAAYPDVQRLVCFMLRRGLKSQKDIQRVLLLFDIDKSLFESSFVAMPEKDTLGSISRAIPYPCEQQFCVGKYKIDLYFPSIRLAVSCAEHRHIDYDLSLDLKRRRFITTQLSCQFLEFDPYAMNFSVLDVIRDIVEKLVCPEYTIWSQCTIQGPWKNNVNKFNHISEAESDIPPSTTTTQTTTTDPKIKNLPPPYLTMLV
jgi:hypothetical protein